MKVELLPILTNVITDEDGVTVAEVTVKIYNPEMGLLEVKTTGSSKTCEPDVPDDEIGIELALGRALRKASRELISDAYSKVHDNDERRKRQEENSRRGLEKKREANLKFQTEFASLIESLHPGTFGKTKVYSNHIDFVANRRRDLPA